MKNITKEEANIYINQYGVAQRQCNKHGFTKIILNEVFTLRGKLVTQEVWNKVQEWCLKSNETIKQYKTTIQELKEQNEALKSKLQELDNKMYHYSENYK